MESYFEAVIQGFIRGVTSYVVQRKLKAHEKTIQCPTKRKDGFQRK